jgi:DNA primase
MLPDAIGQVITEADKYLEGFAYHARIELFGRLRDKETDLGRRAYYDLLIDVSKKLELMLPLFSVGEQSKRYREQIEKISELKEKSSLGELLKKMSAQKVIDTGILDEDLKPLGRDEVNALADKIKLEDFYPERMVAQLAVTAAYADEEEVRDHADQLLLELCAGTKNGSEKYLAPKRVVETLEKLACILPG